MTGLLLDTHVWIWALRQPERFNSRARRQIEDAQTELYLSPISIWEAYHLALRRKLRGATSFGPWLEASRKALPVREAPITLQVAEEASRLHLPQGDFGDVFLAATALAFGHTLVTADQQLLDLRSIKTLAAGR